MKKEKQKNIESWSEKILALVEPKSFKSPPSLTVLIPTYNSSERLYQTLKTLEGQQKNELVEVIVIDAGSSDRTFEMVQYFGSLVSRFYTVETRCMYEMIRRGVFLANRDYIMILYPGSVFTVTNLFSHFQGEVEEHSRPDLLYCGALRNHSDWEEGRLLYPFSKGFLKKGIAPTSLNCCWVKKSFFLEIPRTHLKIEQQLSLDFFIRAYKQKPNGIVAMDRYFIDVAPVPMKDLLGWKSYLEILRILKKEFGLFTSFKWLRSAEHVSLLRWIWYLLKLKVT